MYDIEILPKIKQPYNITCGSSDITDADAIERTEKFYAEHGYKTKPASIFHAVFSSEETLSQFNEKLSLCSSDIQEKVSQAILFVVQHKEYLPMYSQAFKNIEIEAEDNSAAHNEHGAGAGAGTGASIATRSSEDGGAEESKEADGVVDTGADVLTVDVSTASNVPVLGDDSSAEAYLP